MLQFGGENVLLSCEDGLRVAPADHIGSAVGLGKDVAEVREDALLAADPGPGACPQHPTPTAAAPARAPSVLPQKGSGQLACKFKCGL